MTGLHLAHAPIVEAILDIHCDLPPGTDFSALQERAEQALSVSYPKVRRQITQRHHLGIFALPEASQRVTGLQFLTEDEKQIVQFRGEGYTFNRLAPYGRLDDYLADIEWSWNIFRDLTQPVQIRAIGLRYINRILLPLHDGRMNITAYLNVSPLLPEQETLELLGFLNQNSAVEIATGNHVNITLAMQPIEDEKLPIIFDIETSDLHIRSPETWQDVREAIDSLRRLKNRVFERTLTRTCLNLFQQP